MINALSDSDRNAVLKYHNDYRSSLANGKEQNIAGSLPQGKNIKQMCYESAIETSAANWASQCTMEHSGGNYGENLFMTSDPDISDSLCFN